MAPAESDSSAQTLGLAYAIDPAPTSRPHTQLTSGTPHYLTATATVPPQPAPPPALDAT